MLLNTDNCDVGTNKSFLFFLVSLMKCNQDEVHLLEQVELIDLIETDLLKSAELTGVWEKKIRDIEHGTYDVKSFKAELNQMVKELADQVKSQQYKQKQTVCPKCEIGHLIRGKNAWGCSDWKKGCKFTLPFEYKGINISDSELNELLQKGVSKYNYIFNKKKPKDLKKMVFNNKLKLGVSES